MINNFRKAGEISKKAKKYGRSLIKEKANVLEVAEKIEAKIKELGGGLSFPVDISINEMAAHYNPRVDDSLTLKKGDLVKIDMGAHYKGYVSDTAFTVSVGKNKENEKLITASEEALKKAISMATPGTKVREIGKEIEKTIRKYGLVPVKNLLGHGVGYYIAHKKPNIPPFDNKDDTKLRKDQVIAIEPFATNGTGYVKNGSGSEVYMISSDKNTREFRDILSWIKKEFKTLPFAKRQIVKKFGKMRGSLAINLLIKQKIIKEFSTLPEKSKNCKVSQSEHTLIVGEKPEVLT